MARSPIAASGLASPPACNLPRPIPTKVSIDGLYSRFKEEREEKWGEVLLRSNERSIDVLNPIYDSNNNMIAGTLNDAWVRTEHYLRKSQTEFYQLGGSWDQDVTDKFRFTLLGGFSKSDASIPVETTFVYDDRDAAGYKYDYRNMESPVLTFGTSVTDPANFQLAEIRDRPSSTVNKFRTAQLRAEWDVAEGFQVKAGGLYRRFSFDTAGFTRDTVVCGNGGADRVLGTLTCSPTSALWPERGLWLPGDPGPFRNLQPGQCRPARWYHHELPDPEYRRGCKIYRPVQPHPGDRCQQHPQRHRKGHRRLFAGRCEGRVARASLCAQCRHALRQDRPELDRHLAVHREQCGDQHAGDGEAVL